MSDMPAPRSSIEDPSFQRSSYERWAKILSQEDLRRFAWLIAEIGAGEFTRRMVKTVPDAEPEALNAIAAAAIYVQRHSDNMN